MMVEDCFMGAEILAVSTTPVPLVELAHVVWI
jgi:hypothetical protein